MRISDWSSDVCSSDLSIVRLGLGLALVAPPPSDLFRDSAGIRQFLERPPRGNRRDRLDYHRHVMQFMVAKDAPVPDIDAHRSQRPRSEERRVGNECVSTDRSRWSQYHSTTRT